MTITITASADPARIEANGEDSSLITAEVKEGNVPLPGETVTMTTDLGHISSVTDHGDGTYSAVLTSTEEGTATITARVREEEVLTTVGAGTQGPP